LYLLLFFIFSFKAHRPVEHLVDTYFTEFNTNALNPIRTPQGLQGRAAPALPRVEPKSGPRASALQAKS
jgi:hypothetical protein